MSRENDRVAVYKDKAGQWRWRRRAANGTIISGSEDGYENYEHAKRMAEEINPDCDIVYIKDVTQF